MQHKTRFSIFLFVVFFVTLAQGQCAKELSLRPALIEANISGDILKGPSVLNDSDRFVWGASVIQGDDGKYHVLYSTWECGDTLPPFSDSWVLHSKIAYAISDFPDRDFEFRKIVLRGRMLDGDADAWDAQMVHNPHIRKFEGTYYLYYIGSRDPGVQPEGSPGAALGKRDRVQQSQCIGVISFKNFEDLLNGNFTRPDKPILEPRTRVKPDHIINPSPQGIAPMPDNIIVTNPAVVFRPSDEKYLLYFKGNLYNPGWSGVHGVAIGDTPCGPFKALDEFVFDIRDEDGHIVSGEDPYVWYDKSKENFFAILKDFSGRITGGEAGLAILKSNDGVQWEKPVHPFFMRKQIELSDGEMVPLNRLERPQLLFDETGNPMVLFCAASLVNCRSRKDGVTFNVHIPLCRK